VSYLARLKNLKGAPTHPTKTTKTPETAEKPVSVVFVGCLPTHIQNSHPDAGLFNEAANDPPADLKRQTSNDPEPPAARPAPAPARKPTGQRYQEWVNTWRPLADAYHAHHFSCPTCIAAGKGYGLRCGAGAALWAAYDQAEPSQAKVLAQAPIGISTSSSTSTSKDSPEASA
jgi:hypothetical protein